MAHQTATRSMTGNPWLHRTAWLLAVATFPLIWMGGLVTTYGAGMAVPDWPNTYGYNLFLYPLESWLAVWDVFLEHSHRLIGAAVGFITIALAVLLWKLDERRWMRWLGVAAIVGVLFQGTLGGLRVIGDELLLAKVHGCTAPLFFSLAVALVVFTSPAWRTGSGQLPGGRRLAWWALAATVGIWVQIVLGAQLRHIPPLAALGWFVLWVWLHLIVAGLLLAGIVTLLFLVRRQSAVVESGSVAEPKRSEAGTDSPAGTAARESIVQSDVRRIRRRAAWLLGLFSLQVVLGLATWVTNYGYPAWFTNYLMALQYTVVAEGRLQAVTTTAHVGVGSLALVSALTLTLWLFRSMSHAPSGSRPLRTR